MFRGIRFRVAGLALVAIAAASLTAGLAAEAAGETAKRPGGAKLPRFASLRAKEVNLRTGPGVRYPVDWVFVHRNLPIEIIAEFGVWRKIRDWQGAEGWVHKSLLSGRRTVIVIGGTQSLRREAATTAPPVARVEERVVGRLLRCEKLWCRVEFDGFRGWLPHKRLWGVYENEK